MKKLTPMVMLAAGIVLAVGCAGNPDQIKIPDEAAEMMVDLSWEGIQACTHESPEIRVSSIPGGTDELRVKLKNVDVPEWNHGGGIVKHDGSGIIPAGGLHLGYNGPCPPAGTRHAYELSVMAVDAEGAIIGFGKTRKPFPPKQ
ncbi:hypothetical protein [Desulfosarcina sp.]|jgi:phosphatidylethanolamine-binding protein (PEBP) family uncharacterized protein|uniref:YbhB/YbcL family Raf kinase inhibitor-like protein n=1 Tax=Desulfosarcina sp. TaxID=2027861 RepID=UPI00397104C0